MRKLINKVMLFLIVGQILLPLIEYFPTIAEANTGPPQTIQIDFFGDGAGETAYSKQQYISKTVNIGKEVSTWSVTINGSNLGKVGTYDSATGNLTLGAIYGKYVTLYGRRDTNPGHHIQRDSSGKRWQHEGEKTPNMRFTASSLTHSGGISTRPGVIPNVAQIVGTGESTTYTVSDPNNDLRLNGNAVTHSYGTEPPNEFFTEKKFTGQKVPISAVIESSVKIVGTSVSSINDTTATAVSFGSSGTGLGDIKLQMNLDDTGIYEGSHCDNLGTGYMRTPYTAPAEGRNYCMNVQTDWEGATYAYQGSIEVTFEAPPPVAGKPDLQVVDITASGLSAGVPSNVNFSYKNVSADITKSFVVRVVDNANKKVYEQTIPSIRKDETKTGTFSYTPTKIGQVSFTLTLDATGILTDETPKSNNVLTKTFPVGGSTAISGDFDIINTPMAYGDALTLRPKDITTSFACTYKSHYYKMSGSNGDVYTSMTSNKTADTSYTRSTYPAGFGAGAYDVTLRVLTTCSDTPVDVKTKPLFVSGPTSNSGPEFEAGWYSPYGGPKKHEIVCCSEKLTLKILDDYTIPTPTDPEGDPIKVSGWDFANSPSAWMRSLLSKNGYSNNKEWSYDWITMDTLGYHTVNVSMVDGWGAVSTRSVGISVVPPNPVPRIAGSSFVKVNRTLSPPLTSTNSYSPLNRSINHSLDEWKVYDSTNTMVNEGKPTVFNSIGTYSVTLSVIDSGGLRSLEPAKHTIEVIPDTPPIARADVPGIVFRNSPVTIKNESYSPDGDTIVKTWAKWSYDSDADGNYNDEVQHSGIDSLGFFSFTPPGLGYVRVQVYAEEDYGLTDIKEYIVKVDNGSPEVSFQTSSQVIEPNPDKSMPLSPKDMTTSAWQSTSLTFMNVWKNWYYDVSEGTLASGKLYDPNGFMSISSNNLRATSWTWNSNKESYQQMPLQTNYHYGDDILEIERDNRSGIYEMYPSRTKYFVKNGTVVGSRLVPWSSDSRNVCFINQDLNYIIINYFNYYFQRHHAEVYKLSDYREGKLGTPLFSSETHYLGMPSSYSTVCDGIVRSTGMAPYVATKSISFDSYITPDYTGSDSFRGLKAEFATENERVYDPQYCENESGYCNKQMSYMYIKDGLGNLIYRTKIIYDPYDLSSVRDYANFVLSSDGKTLYVRLYVSYRPTTTFILDLTTGTKISNPEADVKYYEERRNTCTKSGYDSYGDYQCREYKSDWYLIKTKNSVQQWESYRFTTNEIGTHYQSSWKTQTELTYMHDNTNTKVFACTSLCGSHYYFNKSNGSSISDKHTFQPGAPAGDSMPMKGGAPLLPCFNSHTTGCGAEYITKHKTKDIYKTIINGNVIIISDAMTQRQIETIDITSYIPAGFSVYPHDAYDPTGNYTYIGDSKLAVKIRSADGSQVGRVMLESDPRISDQTNPEPLTAGQLINYSQENLSDLNLGYSLKFNAIRYNGNTDKNVAGFSFKILDTKNMYRLATGPEKTVLYKIVNGIWTIIASTNYLMPENTFVSFNVKTTGSNIKVKINGALVIDANDTTFNAGKLGPFSHRSFAEFKDMSLLISSTPSTSVVNDVATIGDSVTFSPFYSDPENDPKYAFGRTWRYEHVDPTKFLNAGDGYNGLSSFHNTEHSNPISLLDKTGLYKITYIEHDDVFPALFRKMSNLYYKYFIIHRKPIVQFTVSLNGDNTVNWSDTSYDPDRCSSGGSCQTGYSSNKGIFNRKYYYIAPDGTTANKQLIYPNACGTYTVGEAVQDEYSAWSSILERTITVPCGPSLPPANNIPFAEMWFPNSVESSKPNTINSTTPTLVWGKWDADGMYFTHYQTQVIEDNGTYVYDSGEVHSISTSSQESIVVPMGLLSEGKRYSVHVRVKDGKEWSPWSTPTWMYVNVPPKVTITNPDSEDLAKPTIVRSTKPTINWVVEDPDTPYIHHYVITAIDSTWTLNLNTGVIASNSRSWTSTVNLTPNKKYGFFMAVSDGINDSAWTPQPKWLMVNRLPVSTLTNPLGISKDTATVVDTPTPSIKWFRSDADGDNYMGYHVQVLAEDDSVVVEYKTESSSSTDTSMSWRVEQPLNKNQYYKVRVRDYDGFEWGDWSSKLWMLVSPNEAPVVSLIYPNGESWKPTLEYSSRPVIKWKQEDADPFTVFKSFRIRVYDQNGSVVIDSGNQTQDTNDTENSWKVPSDLTRGEIYAVEVQASDGQAWSEWSKKGWIEINDLPTVSLVWPNGTNASPDVINSQLPVIQWNQYDKNTDPIFTHYQVQIIDATNNVILDSGELDQNSYLINGSWQVSEQLPNGEKLYVRVRVKDGREWSNWSDVRWFLINTVPKSEITTPQSSDLSSPSLIYGTQRPRIEWLQLDSEIPTTFTQYRVQVLAQDGSVVSDSGIQSQSTSSNTQTWTPSTNLSYGTLYKVRVMARDEWQWSNWSSEKYFELRPNTPPTVAIAYPTGNTRATAEKVSNIPTIIFDQYDPDTNAIMQGYQVQVLNEAGTAIVYDSGDPGNFNGYELQNTATDNNGWVRGTSFTIQQTSKSTPLASGLANGLYYRVHVRAFDGAVWGPWSSQKMFFVNRPPVADFDWSPNPIWEGDTITISNRSTDPDGDALISEWIITGPNGYSKTDSSSNTSISGSDTVNRTGTYSVTLKVTDPYGFTNSITKNIIVGQLGITGQVNHTPQWEANRQAYNTANPTAQRSAQTFWAGERFDLVGLVTDTGASGTVATNVRVVATGIGNTNLTKATSERWSGHLGSDNATEDFETLGDGAYNFTFTVTYSNGVQKSATVTIYISGNWNDFFKLNRKF